MKNDEDEYYRRESPVKSNRGLVREHIMIMRCGRPIKRKAVGLGSKWKFDNSEYEQHMKEAVDSRCGCIL